MRHRQSAACAALAFFASACASTTQTLHVTPEIELRSGVDGRGATVAVEVEDRRGPPPPRGPDEPEILVAPDVDRALRRAVVAGLAQRGFVTSDAEPTRSLRVEILDASLVTESGQGTMLVRSQAELRFVVRNGRSTHENTYRSQRDRRVVLLPNSTRNEEQLNFSMSQALQQFFDDRALLNALAR